MIPVQALTKEEQLVLSFRWLVANEIQIKKHLCNIIPEYIKVGLKIKNIINKM